MNAMKQEFNRF